MPDPVGDEIFQENFDDSPAERYFRLRLSPFEEE